MVLRKNISEKKLGPNVKFLNFWYFSHSQNTNFSKGLKKNNFSPLLQEFVFQLYIFPSKNAYIDIVSKIFEI